MQQHFFCLNLGLPLTFGIEGLIKFTVKFIYNINHHQCKLAISHCTQGTTARQTSIITKNDEIDLSFHN